MLLWRTTSHYLSYMAPLRTPEYMQMVGRLRAARKTAGLTQAQVAQRLSKPQSYVSKIEKAERRIDPVELARFAHLYGKEISWFVDTKVT